MTLTFNSNHKAPYLQEVHVEVKSDQHYAKGERS